MGKKWLLLQVLTARTANIRMAHQLLGLTIFGHTQTSVVMDRCE